MRRQQNVHTKTMSGGAATYYLRWLVILVVLAVVGQFVFDEFQDWQGGGKGGDEWRVEAEFLDIQAGACGDVDRSIEPAWKVTANGRELSETEDILGEHGHRSGKVKMRGQLYFWNSAQDRRLAISGWVCDLNDGECGWLGDFTAGFQVRDGYVTPGGNVIEERSGGRFAIPVASMETACEMSVVVRIRPQ